MNIYAIVTKPDEDSSAIDPLDDPVFIENMEKTYESFRSEYKLWVNSPRRRSNGGLGSGYMV